MPHAPTRTSTLRSLWLSQIYSTLRTCYHIGPFRVAVRSIFSVVIIFFLETMVFANRKLYKGHPPLGQTRATLLLTWAFGRTQQKTFLDRAAICQRRRRCHSQIHFPAAAGGAPPQPPSRWSAHLGPSYRGHRPLRRHPALCARWLLSREDELFLDAAIAGEAK